MNSSHSTPAEAHEHNSPGLTTVLGRLMLSLVAILAILYASLIAISRTEGFQELMREQIAARLGLSNLALDSIHLDSRLELIIRGLSFNDPEAEIHPCGLRIDVLMLKIRPEFRPRPRLAIKSAYIQTAEIDFLLSEDGVIKPKEFAPASALIGDMLSVAAPDPARASLQRTRRPEAQSALEDMLDRKIDLVLRSSVLVWRNRSGRVLRKIDDCNMSISPIEIKSGAATYIDMTARTRSGRRGPISDLQIELIRLPDGRSRIIDRH